MPEPIRTCSLGQCGKCGISHWLRRRVLEQNLGSDSGCLRKEEWQGTRRPAGEVKDCAELGGGHRSGGGHPCSWDPGRDGNLGVPAQQGVWKVLLLFFKCGITCLRWYSGTLLNKKASHRHWLRAVVLKLRAESPHRVAYQIPCKSDIYIPICNSSKFTAFMAGGGAVTTTRRTIWKGTALGWLRTTGREEREGTLKSVWRMLINVDLEITQLMERIMTSKVAPGDWWGWSWRKKEAATANGTISYLNNLLIESMTKSEDKHILALIMLYPQTERRLGQWSLG